MSTNLAERIPAILDGASHDEETEIAKTDAIKALISGEGWAAVCECLFDLLRDDHAAAHWRVVMHVFWGAVLDRRALPVDELIAWLYHRFDPDGNAEDNEVWSITSKLKNVGYLSAYKPLLDPAVQEHLRVIRSQA